METKNNGSVLVVNGVNGYELEIKETNLPIDWHSYAYKALGSNTLTWDKEDVLEINRIERVELNIFELRFEGGKCLAQPLYPNEEPREEGFFYIGLPKNDEFEDTEHSIAYMSVLEVVTRIENDKAQTIFINGEEQITLPSDARFIEDYLESLIGIEVNVTL